MRKKNRCHNEIDNELDTSNDLNTRKKNVDNELGIDFDELKDKFNKSIDKITKKKLNNDCVEVEVLSDESQKLVEFQDNDSASNVSIDSIESDFNLLHDENKHQSSLSSKKKNKLITKDYLATLDLDNTVY
jgi:hypothetical protein